MNRLSRQIASYWTQFRSVVRNEFRTIFTDGGVMLVLIFALLVLYRPGHRYAHREHRHHAA